MNQIEDQTTKPDPRLAGAPWLTAEHTQRVFQVLDQAGFNARAVGGTVRNTLLGEPVNDIDIAVDAAPDAVMAAARRANLKVVPTGITHGTVTIVVSGIPFEVTALRRDVSTDGRRATVAYTSDWKADAERRDFTINAIYCDRHGSLLDPVGGLDDIAARRVRFIGNPHARIREDYLRILRFFRFSAHYAGGVLDREGLTACVEERHGLQCLSAERVHHELLRLLAAPAALSVIEQMAAQGFIADLFGNEGNVPALAALLELALPEPSANDAVLRLGALVINTPQDVPTLKARLRLSNAEANRLAAAAEAADEIAAYSSPEEIRSLIYRRGTQAAMDGIALVWARQKAAGQVARTQQDDRTYQAMMKTAASWTAPPMPISGREIVARGIGPGPRVSVIIEAFEAWWIEAGFPDDPELIATKLSELVVVTNS